MPKGVTRGKRSRKPGRKRGLDPVTFEILKNRLWAMNEEAATSLKLVTGNPVANEAHDFNVAILSPRGDVVVVGSYIVLHATTLGLLAESVLRDFSSTLGIHPGDMFLSNDPWLGGALHQSDVMVLAPVFWEKELVAWVGATIHHIDVGGPVEGQVQVGAQSVFGEEPLMPPMKLMEKGKIRFDVERDFLRKSRLPAIAALDLRAQIAANNTNARQIKEFIKEHGPETFQEVLNGIIEYTERKFRARLRELPDGTWRERSYVDYEGSIYKICVAMTKRKDTLTFDFRGSSPQAPAVINTPYSGLVGGLYASVLCYLCWDMPWCPAGVMRSIRIVSDPGTVVDATYPAGVCKSSTTSSWVATNVTSATLGKMLASSDKYRSRAMAVWAGTTLVEELFGTDQYGKYFGGTILDTMAGGGGARTYSDGIDTGGFLADVAVKMANVEDYELIYPMLYLVRRQQRDSGGPGKFRGGAGVNIMYIPHGVEEIPRKIIHTHGVSQPVSLGVYGGYPSTTNEPVIIRNSNVRELMSRGVIPTSLEEVEGTVEVQPAISVTRQGKDDVYFAICTGGGGYGDPLERDPVLVQRDVRSGLVSLEWAGKIYGVVLDRSCLEVDRAATERLRRSLKETRAKSGEKSPD